MLFNNFYIVLIIKISYFCIAQTKQQNYHVLNDDYSLKIDSNNNSGNFEIIHEWKFLDFEYPTYEQRKQSIKSREFIPENNLPLGIDIFKNRIFLTTPRWKDGVPASLNYISYPNAELSPSLKPFPTWDSHAKAYQLECNKIVSVYRTSIDICGRLWAIDSGIINATVNLNQACPPKILMFDLLNNDKMLLQYELPSDQVKQDSLHSNILIHINGNDCDDAFAYITDVWRYGLVVYSLKKNKSWRVTNLNFYPNPIAADFNIYGLNFQWFDGVFGMSILCSQTNSNIKSEYINHEIDDNCNLYFHPMASYKEFMVPLLILNNETLWAGGNVQGITNYFVAVGDRGYQGQSSTSGITSDGVMFFTQVHRDSIACWDTSKPYIRNNIVLFRPSDPKLIQFPNDLKVDKFQTSEGVWIISNRLPIFLYSKLDYTEINFRILRADVNKMVDNNMCNPLFRPSNDVLLSTLSEGQCF